MSPSARLIDGYLNKLATQNRLISSSDPELLQIRREGTNALPYLRVVLRERTTRRSELLGFLKQQFPRWSPVLQDLGLDSHGRDLRCSNAAYLLERFGEAAAPLRSELLALTQSEFGMAPHLALSALLATGKSQELCRELKSLFENPAPDGLRVRAIQALIEVRPPCDFTISRMQLYLTNGHGLISIKAAEVLLAHRPEDPVVLSRVKEIHEATKDDAVRLNATRLLIQSEKWRSQMMSAVISDLLTHMSSGRNVGSDPDELTQNDLHIWRLIELLPKLPLEKGRKEQLVEKIDSYLREENRLALGVRIAPPLVELGWPQEYALELCTSELQRPGTRLPHVAVESLQQIHKRKPVDVGAVQSLLTNAFPAAQIFAATLHWKRFHDATVVLPILQKHLDQWEKSAVNQKALLLETLQLAEQMGAAAGPIVAHLRAVQHDVNPEISRAAARAVQAVAQPRAIPNDSR
jgi:hypothetical protein